MNNLYTTLQEITAQGKIKQEVKHEQQLQKDREVCTLFCTQFFIPFLTSEAKKGKDNAECTFFFWKDNDKDWFFFEKGEYNYHGEFNPNNTVAVQGLGKRLNLSCLQSYLHDQGVAFLFDDIESVPRSESLYFSSCLISWATDQTRVAKKFRKHHTTEKTDQQVERDKLTAGLRYDILKRDGYKCKICGRSTKDGVKLHVDHIIPIAKGGKTVPENLQTLCQDCNLGKGTKDF